MNFNLTFGHFASFVCLVSFATMFFKGWHLIRVIAFTFLWQLLTPVRGFWEDGLMLGTCLWLTEYLYHRVRKIIND